MEVKAKVLGLEYNTNDVSACIDAAEHVFDTCLQDYENYFNGSNSCPTQTDEPLTAPVKGPAYMEAFYGTNDGSRVFGQRINSLNMIKDMADDFADENMHQAPSLESSIANQIIILQDLSKHI